MAINLLKYTFYILLITVLGQCSRNENTASSYTPIVFQRDTIHHNTIITDTLCSYERLLIQAGLIDLKTVDTTIVIDIRYATQNNIWKKNLYNNFSKCYVHPTIAQKLSLAQSFLKQIDSGYSLVIIDAVRPRSVQQDMWNTISLSHKLKVKYLANPDLTSLHNYGMAVDVSILKNGKELDMGSQWDDTTEISYPILEDYFLKLDIVNEYQLKNRKLLKEVMTKAGFVANKYEWWHFGGDYRKNVVGKIALIESFDSIIFPVKEYYPIAYTSDTVLFKVQITTSIYKLSEKKFVGLQPETIEYYIHQGYYKYTTGSFTNLNQTYRYRDSIRSIGYTDAFVVCFLNGKRISIQDAILLSD
ncbi:MAG: M15 family metallopeptidase [Bacteroidales bacterium]